MEETISEIIFSFGIRKGTIEKKATLKDKKEKLQYQFYRRLKLPITMEAYKYGMILHHDIIDKVILVQITEHSLAKIRRVEDPDSEKYIGNDVEIIKNGRTILIYQE